MHNFQKYLPAEPSGGPQLHLVSGGGGAFMHATHPYANADFDSRARNNPTSRFYAVPQESFPSRNQSVRHFAGLLVPGVVRMMGHLLLFLAGVLTGGIAGWLDRGRATRTPGWCRAGPPAAAGTGAAALGQPTAQPLVGSGPAGGQRRRLPVGALAASAGYLLDPEHFQTYQLVWLAMTVLHCVLNALVRRSGWWRPATSSTAT